MEGSTSGDLIFVVVVLFSCSSLRALAVLGAGGQEYGQGHKRKKMEAGSAEGDRASLVLRKLLLMDWEKLR